MENDNSAYWANRCAAYDTEKEELIQWQRNEIQTLQGSCQRLSYNLSMQQSIIAHNFEAVVRATVDPRSGQCSSSVLLQYLSQVKGGLVGMDMSVNNNNNINNNNININPPTFSFYDELSAKITSHQIGEIIKKTIINNINIISVSARKLGIILQDYYYNDRIRLKESDWRECMKKMG
eukprot:Tbor_TRINITY_DN4929_c4_g1::TRINITY_DN4929_c4_g1_i1::g.9714::m.9714